jgi:hypothetical protein
LPRVRDGAAEGEQQREDPLQGALLRRRHLPRLMYVPTRMLHCMHASPSIYTHQQLSD